MKRLLVLLIALGALAAPGLAHAAGPCGLPTSRPLWVDHGVPAVSNIMAKPGVVLAVSSGAFPAEVRTKGAKTIYWDMYLNSKRVGTPVAPADPALLVDRANKLFDFAVAQTACATPYIVLNELFGANLETPWSASATQYRANVLAFVQALAARGARPLLLVSQTPYTASDEAAAWWRATAQYADIIPEVYFSARNISAYGPIVGSRKMRLAMRRSIGAFTSIGIPTAKLGVVLGFQTKKGGRDGLQPSAAWFRVVKWQALAAREVAAEMKLGTIVSWGWAAYTADAADPDKPRAACVYLWTRNTRLCNGPAAAGPDFNASLVEGQLRIAAGRVCAIGTRGISAGQVALLTRTTGDRTVAFTALLARFSETPFAKVTAKQVRDAERAIVRLRFGGSFASYRAALRRANATVAIARAALADELRRAKIEAQMSGRRPTAAEVNTFYFSYPELVVRPVRARPAPDWLGRRTTGLALRSVAPERVFSLPTHRRLNVFGPDRTYAVTALDDARALGTVPLEQARPAIAAALASFARRASFETWTMARQRAAEAQALCRRDEVPDPGTVRLTAYLPFLSLTGE